MLQPTLMEKVAVQRPDQKTIPRGRRNAVAAGGNGHHCPERAAAQSPAGQERHQCPLDTAPRPIQVDRVLADGRGNRVFRHQDERARRRSRLRDADRQVGISTERRSLRIDGAVEAAERHPDLEFFLLAINLDEGDIPPRVPSDGFRLGSVTTADKPAMDRVARLIEIEAFASFGELRMEYELIFRCRQSLRRIAQDDDIGSQFCFTFESTFTPSDHICVHFSHQCENTMTVSEIG